MTDDSRSEDSFLGSEKGIELPVNMLVLLAVAVIVLLSAVAWFLTTFSQTSGSQEDIANFRSCCSLYVNNDCQPDISQPGNEFPEGTNSVCGVDNEGNKLTLSELAQRAGVTGDIRNRCGCRDTGTSGSGGGNTSGDTSGDDSEPPTSPG